MAEKPSTWNTDTRLIIADLKAFFPDKNVLSITDVEQYTGKSKDWIDKNLMITKRGIALPKLASRLNNLS